MLLKGHFRFEEQMTPVTWHRAFWNDSVLFGHVSGMIELAGQNLATLFALGVGVHVAGVVVEGVVCVVLLGALVTLIVPNVLMKSLDMFCVVFSPVEKHLVAVRTLDVPFCFLWDSSR